MISNTSKKAFVLLLVLCMLTSLLPAISYAAAAGTTFVAGDFIYKVNSDTTTVELTAIRNGVNLTGAVTVPKTVTYGAETLTVTKLGNAFKNQGDKTKDMTSLVLPDTITIFTGTATFYGCKFTSVHLPTALTGQSDNAGYLWNTFQWCSNLTSVILPAGITKCYGTFRNSVVRNVTIAGTSQVDFFGDSDTVEARAWNDGITGIKIYYPNGGTAPTRITGSFTATSEQLLAAADTFTYGDFTYTVNSDGVTVTLTSIAVASLPAAVIVPETVFDTNGGAYTVTKLGAAFYNVEAKTRSMTSLVLPDTITYFTRQATFWGCTGLTSIHLPAGLTGDPSLAGRLTNTFGYCSNLGTVELPEGITSCYGTFGNTSKSFSSGVRTVIIKGKSQVKFFRASGTLDARAWQDGITGITIYYPYDGTVPDGTGNATVIRLNDELNSKISAGSDFTVDQKIDAMNRTYTLGSGQNMTVNANTDSTAEKFLLTNATVTTSGGGKVIMNGTEVSGTLVFDANGKVSPQDGQVLSFKKNRTVGLSKYATITAGTSTKTFNLSNGTQTNPVVFDVSAISGKTLFGINVSNVPDGKTLTLSEP